ncbi:dihydrofolate reductase family protein [Flammeovirga sp. SubArs3]|uniref:dihydrofolate reductase family protein n=1 Tax=Flammeovirga sp. SubArs3 TaxID=2995316 RepID=UPI00248B779E|nr:dihydrofolate reductase family protein [Flammeovirga sp. SubArs3]
MRKIISFVTMSIDGKIANSKGSTEWLEDLQKETHEEYGFTEFYQGIDTTIMGNTTYQKLKNSGKEFPYKGKINYVITKNTETKKDDNVDFIADDVMGTIRSLKNQPSDKDIWLIGGGKVNALLQDNGLIDELRLFIAPIVLGNGVPLFSPFGKTTTFELTFCKNHPSGIVEMHYHVTR